MGVKVKVVSRFKHWDTGKYHDPPKVMTLKEAHAERLARAGCVEILQKPKVPPEDKALRPTENRGAV